MPPAPCFYRRESIIRPPLRRQAGRRFFGCPAQSSRRKALPFLLNFRTGKNPRRFPDGRRGAVIRRSGAPDASYSRLVPPRSPAGNGGNVLRTDGKTIEVPLAGRTAEAVCTPAGRTKKRFARRRLAIFLRHSRLCFCARLPLFHPPIRRSLPVLACRCPQPSSHPPQTAPALRVPILHRRGRPPAPFLHRAPDMKKPSAQRNRSACTTPCRLPFLRAAAPLGIDPAAPHAKAQPQRADGAPPQIRPIRFTPCRARARFARYAPRKAAAYAGAAHPNRRRTLPAVRAAQARAGGRL